MESIAFMTLEQFKDKCVEVEERKLKDEGLGDWVDIIDCHEYMGYYFYWSWENDIRYCVRTGKWRVRGLPIRPAIGEYEWHYANSLEEALEAKQDRYDYVFS